MGLRVQRQVCGQGLLQVHTTGVKSPMVRMYLVCTRETEKVPVARALGEGNSADVDEVRVGITHSLGGLSKELGLCSQGSSEHTDKGREL